MRITELILFSKYISKQKQFYESLLGLLVIEEKEKNSGCISFQLRNTLLKFVYSPDATAYHFAINIPSNKAHEALTWLKGKGIKILPLHGTELVNFDTWNAQSLYFYDADNNIVELIARKNLNIIEQDHFGPAHLLNISEIGMAVDNIETTYIQLNRIKPLPIFDGSFEEFCAAGDEEGLFIIINKNKKNWIPVNDKACSSAFKMKGDYSIFFKEGEIIEE